MRLHCAGRVLDLTQPAVMGVLNVTPDSFSDGGRFEDVGAAVAAGQRMVEEGAAIVDVGGESTRPGAAPVGTREQLDRVLPVVERLAARLPARVLISVDTSDPEVMRRVGQAGAHMINDVRAARQPGALEALADSRLALCLVHMLGEPATMQQRPEYRDVVTEVRGMLAGRIGACEAAGVARERLCVDPGFGFGKLLRHNLQLLMGLPELATLGCPLAVGLSRKSMAGALAAAPGEPARPAGARLAASLALASIAVLRGAHIVRAHDVAATLEAVRVASAARAVNIEQRE